MIRFVLAAGAAAALMTAVTSSAMAMNVGSNPAASAPLLEKIARVCDYRGVCFDKYTGRVQAPAYVPYAPAYRTRRVYRDYDYVPRRRFYREEY